MSFEYVIIDPHIGYGPAMMRRMWTRWQARAICVFSNARQRRIARSRGLEIDPCDQVVAAHNIPSKGMGRFIEFLRVQHDVRAVLPHSEFTLSQADAVAVGLELPGWRAHVVPRFRNKYSLKAHLRQTDPELRLNAFARVRSPEEVWARVRASGCERFVLKPNDGFGNRHVRIFDADVSLVELQHYWSTIKGRSILWEEYVGGCEFHCNGQVDAHGGIQIVDVARYYYCSANGRENLRRAVGQVRHGSDEFSSCEAYARRVIAASGLRKLPFHLELKIDERGPCLIECAARLVGSNFAPIVNLLHDGRLDIFDLAAHHIASEQPYPGPSINWQIYNTGLMRKVMGTSERRERLHDVSGLADVEALPEFHTWLRRPFVGQKVRRTTDLAGFPYELLLRAESDADLDHAMERVVRTLRWNERPATPKLWATHAARDLIAPLKKLWP